MLGEEARLARVSQRAAERARSWDETANAQALTALALAALGAKSDTA